ncbi:hypothetical protein P4O66_011444, partial [Electrophorus voltai]
CDRNPGRVEELRYLNVQRMVYWPPVNVDGVPVLICTFPQADRRIFSSGRWWLCDHQLHSQSSFLEPAGGGCEGIAAEDFQS